MKSKIYLIHGDAKALEERKAGLAERFGAKATVVRKGKRYRIAKGGGRARGKKIEKPEE